jgi:hypothetical protein
LTSERKVRANRANAQASTGPKTTHGRFHAARNARRHGLNVPICSDPVWSEQAQALAREIVGTDANREIQELARRVAEAQIDVFRVRRARHHLLASALYDPDYESPAAQRKKIELVAKYEKLRAQFPLFVQSVAPLEQYVRWRPEGPQKFATILSDMSKQLASLDRYERRTLSRRNLAIRAFDDLRRRLDACGSIN